MKRAGVTLLFTFFLIVSFAQIDFIKPVGENPFRTKVKMVTDSSIIYQTGRSGPEFTMHTKGIDYIEYGGQRVVYYNYKPKEHDINIPELQTISRERPMDLMKPGGKVFIPVSSNIKRNMLGNIFMRESLPEYNVWEIVNTEAEAEFILNFIYDDKGSDKVYFTLKTRENKVFYTSAVVRAETSFSPTSESLNSVKSLLRTVMKRIKKN